MYINADFWMISFKLCLETHSFYLKAPLFLIRQDTMPRKKNPPKKNPRRPAKKKKRGATISDGGGESMPKQVCNCVCPCLVQTLCIFEYASLSNQCMFKILSVYNAWVNPLESNVVPLWFVSHTLFTLPRLVYKHKTSHDLCLPLHT